MSADRGIRGRRASNKLEVFLVASVQALEFSTFTKGKTYCSLFRMKKACSFSRYPLCLP